MRPRRTPLRSRTCWFGLHAEEGEEWRKCRAEAEYGKLTPEGRVNATWCEAHQCEGDVHISEASYEYGP